VAVTLSDLPRDLNPKGFHIHPDWLGSKHWPIFKEVLNEWCGPIVPDIEKAMVDGSIPCILGVNGKRFRSLRELASKTKCHVAGYLVLVPCDVVDGNNESTSDGTGSSSEQSDLSNNAGGENTGSE